MIKEIGSNFWLTKNDLKLECDSEFSMDSFNINTKNTIWTSTCRSAIYLALKCIDGQAPKIAVLPTFSCETVYEPFYKSGYEIRQYSINKKFEISEDIFDLIKDAGVLLIHKYFGFNTFSNIDKVIKFAKENKVLVIEDRTQSLYSDFSCIEADFIVGSIRKWMGVPDGGFLCSNRDLVNAPKKTDKKLEKLKVKASLLKNEYINFDKGSKNEFLRLYAKAEDRLDNQKKVYKISPISYSIQSNLDIAKLKQQRRNNFLTLASKLKNKEIIVFDGLPKDVVPLYFPIYIKDRLKLQKYLAKNNIYAPIIWQKEEGLGLSSYDGLFECLLCLPIDQRYSDDDMTRMASCVNKFFE